MITPQNLIINKHIGHIYIVYIYTHHIYHLYHSNHLSISIKFFGFSSLPEKKTNLRLQQLAARSSAFWVVHPL